jgi:hypothetical protein
MAKKKRKTTWTAEDQLRWDETTRRVRERIAFHEEMAELLGEREREQALLEQLRSGRPAEA